MAVDLDKIWKAVRKKPNVVGKSGILHKKIIDGKEKPSWAFRVYVEHKVPITSLSPDDVIPPEVDGVYTDVVEIGQMHAQGLNTKVNERPVHAGMSAIYAGGTACTVGWFARDKLDDNKLVIVSNNHCTCKENQLPIGHTYVQTSPYDVAHGESVALGTLKRFVPIVYNNPNNPIRALLKWLFCVVLGADCPDVYNEVDVGAIDVDEDDVVLEVADIGPLMGKRRGVLGEMVEKVGRTTGHTTGGLLIDNDYYGPVNYGGGMALVGPVGLVQGHKFTQGGDSSSCFVLEDDKKMCGLGFAGNNTHSLFCHYDNIERLLNVEFVF